MKKKQAKAARKAAAAKTPRKSSGEEPSAAKRRKPSRAVRPESGKTPAKGAPKAEGKVSPPPPLSVEMPEYETPSRDERAGLDRVLASLSSIFGGREIMSDAEIDALLDDKMASGEIPPSAALDPLDEAQSLVYEAWNSEGPERLRLARRALEVSRDCADAYLILAEAEGPKGEATLDLYRKAYEAGRRSLDPALFETAQGNFWAVMETRPYMRARLALAECQWDLGRKEDALGHLRELIRLNPSDNQGVRYILLQCLLESGADEELGELLERYGDDASPEIAYTRALWRFRRSGRGKAADSALAEALRANPHVPAYLLKRKKTSPNPPAAAAPGSPEAAEAYASGALDAWHRTLGALEWLASRS